MLLEGGLLVCEQVVEEADLLIRGGKVAALGSPGTLRKHLPEGGEVLEARGLLVLPGGVDPHVHLDEVVVGVRTADDFRSGGLAAAAGGVTAVIDFCEPRGEESWPQAWRRRLAEAAPCPVDYAFHLVWDLRWKERMADLGAMLAHGFRSFKAYTCYEGFALSPAEMVEVMKAVRGAGVLMVHAEDASLVEMATVGFPNGSPPGAHARARSPLAEELAVSTVACAAACTGAEVYLAHVSTAAALELVAWHRLRGHRVYVETCPHYLCFTAEALEGQDGALYVMSPPLRTAGDREALWKGLGEGLVDVVATDHCPFPKHAKLAPADFRRVPPGVGGLALRLSILHSEGVVKRGLPLRWLVRVTSVAPARIFRLYPRKGALFPGSDGDAILFDPRSRWRVRASDFPGGADHTIYEGWELQGRVVATVLRGRVIFAHGSAVPQGPGVLLHESPLA